MAGPGGEQRRPPPPLRAERWWAPRGSAARSCQRYDFGRRRHAQPRHSGCRVRAIPRRRGNDRRGGRRCTPRRGRGFRRCPGLRRPSRVTGGVLFSRKNSRFLLLSLRTPYTHCAPARARRCRCYRTLAHAALPAVLATCSARLPPPHSLQATVPHVAARRCCCCRTPCNRCAASCARKCCCERSPCTGCGSDRARSTAAAAVLHARAASRLVTTTADAFAAAVLAEVALPPVLAYAGATALVGLAAAPAVLAEATHSRPRQTRRTRPNTQKHEFLPFIELYAEGYAIASQANDSYTLTRV